MKRRAIETGDPRCTSVYSSLWHKDFVALLLSETLLTVSAVAFLFHVGKATTALLHGGNSDVVISLSAFGLGLFLFGPFTAWLTDRYRRNTVFVISTLSLAAVFEAASYLCAAPAPESSVIKEIIWCLCLLGGSFYGLSKRLLTGVLMIDKSESYNRTEANVASMWVSCLSVGVGLMLSEIGLSILDHRTVGHIIALAAVLAAAITALLPFPFRTPVCEVSVFSLDRFVMFRGWQHSLVLLSVSALAVLIMTSRHDWAFNAMAVVGIMVAMLTHEALKNNITERREIAVGLLAMCFPLLAVSFGDVSEVLVAASSLLLGMSWGYVMGGTMSLMLSSCEHCRRGTVVCSHFLAGAAGMLAGACAGL